MGNGRSWPEQLPALWQPKVGGAGIDAVEEEGLKGATQRDKEKGWEGKSTHASSPLRSRRFRTLEVVTTLGCKEQGQKLGQPALLQNKFLPSKPKKNQHHDLDHSLLPSTAPKPAGSTIPHSALSLLPAPVKALLQSSSLTLWALPKAGFKALGTGLMPPQTHHLPHACSLSKSSYF